jgi:hypothetical protein
MAASTPSIAATIAALSEVPGVENVEVNVVAHLMRKKKHMTSARTLQEEVNMAAICPATKPKNGPDTDTGKYSESPPYGVRMVQADHPEMVMVSKEFAHKVIFCVIDTGLDRKNGEFSTSRKCYAVDECGPMHLHSAARALSGTHLAWQYHTLHQTCMHCCLASITARGCV